MPRGQKTKESKIAQVASGNKSEISNQVEADKSVSIGRIISSLSPAQVWAIITACFLVLTGAFGLGYKLKSELDKAELAQIKLESDRLKNQLADTQKYYQGADIKEEFLILYTRYLSAKEASDNARSDQEIQEQRKLAAKNMASFLNDQLQQTKSNKEATDYMPPPIKVGRGTKPEQSTIIFTGDNTAWLLPKEVMKHVNPNFLTDDEILGKARNNSNASKGSRTDSSKSTNKNSLRPKSNR